MANSGAGRTRGPNGLECRRPRTRARWTRDGRPDSLRVMHSGASEDVRAGSIAPGQKRSAVQVGSGWYRCGRSEMAPPLAPLRIPRRSALNVVMRTDGIRDHASSAGVPVPTVVATGDRRPTVEAPATIRKGGGNGQRAATAAAPSPARQALVSAVRALPRHAAPMQAGRTTGVSLCAGGTGPSWSSSFRRRC
jgi:hypothetical protein